MTAGTKGRRMLLLAAIALLSACGTLVRRNERTAPSDPRREMIAALHAGGPHASLGENARLFDPFVGTWDTEYTFYAADGRRRHAPGPRGDRTAAGRQIALRNNRRLRP